MKRFIADLHIHTCLSPCAEIDMTPRRIIDRAVKKGLDIIAISDHNSADNIGVTVKMAEGRGIKVFPSMEITSMEEAHVIAIFSSIEEAVEMQKLIFKGLPDRKAEERLSGYQLVVNEKDEIINFCRKHLLGASDMSIKTLVQTVHSLGGICIASHVDRGSFSVTSQFGFIPEDVAFDALEISYNTDKEKAEVMLSEYKSIPWIKSSDAHHLNDIGRITTSFYLEKPSFEEMVMAFRGQRKIEW
ncbi:MAG: PHP domain-containing protein [Thermodesulfovibrionales bacterium]|nr:PHP domain-containing protein [Thermodesulfovibrionales bacterium]